MKMSTFKKSPNAAEQLLATIVQDEFADLDDEMGATDCSEGCQVEPDGHCPHGYESAGLTLAAI